MRSRGFTLVEVVLALAILALVMSLVFGSFFSQDRVDRAARSEAEAGQAARLFLDRLLMDINQTLAPDEKGQEGPPLAGSPLALESLQGHRLTLLTRSGGGLEGEAGGLGPEAEPVVKVVYLAEPGRTAEGQPNGLMSIRRRVESLFGQEAQEEVICPDVASFALVYLDSKGRESKTWEDPEKLPLEIRISLELAPLGGTPKSYELVCGPLTALAWSRGK